MTTTLPSNPKDAKAQGSRFYFTGKPCKRGHIEARYTTGAACLKCHGIAARTFEESRPEYNKDYHREHRKTYPLSHKNALLKHLYGISKADIAVMYEAQAGKCGICGTPMGAHGGGKHTDAVVDHCHITHKVRSLLCQHCNRGLGLFRDDPVRLEAAAAYMRAHG